MWSEGEALLLRGMYAGRPTHVQSVRVVWDTPGETALAIWPDAECAAPAGYIHHRYGENGKWDRWKEILTGPRYLEKYLWRSNRFLILLEPEKYYSSIYMWEAVSGAFLCYYINFQLPYRRTRLGFDTLDLDLDIVIEPDYEWHWKDTGEYQEGIRAGGITPQWVEAVEHAQSEVGERLSERRYPLNGAWLDWKPDLSWTPPRLPPDWESSD